MISLSCGQFSRRAAGVAKRGSAASSGRSRSASSRATGLPVFDIVSLVTLAHGALAAGPRPA